MTGWTWRLGDVNGDRRIDAVLGPSDGLSFVYVALSNVDGTFQQYKISSFAPFDYPIGYRWDLADLNGDGLADIFVNKIPSDNKGWLIGSRLSLGNGYFQQGGVGAGITQFLDFDFTGWNWRLADVNGDGKVDAVAGIIGSNGTWKIAVALSNTPPTFQSYVMTTVAPSGFTSAWSWSLGDFDGDGKADAIAGLIGGASSGWTQASSTAQGGTTLLTGISNGLGAKTTITYQSSTKYSNTLLPFAIQTVKTITVCDNYNVGTSTCVGTPSTATYAFRGGYYNIPERDFRGFNYANITDSVGPNGEQTITETWFHQGNDLAVDANDPTVSTGYTKGLPYRTRVSKVGSPNVPISETTTTYLADSDNAAPWFTPPAVVTSGL